MIDEDVAKVVEDGQKQRSSDESFAQLSAFYDEMKRRGIAKTSEYGLPPVDTVGAATFRNDPRKAS